MCDLYPEDDESIDKYERNRVELMHECVSKINRGILLARKRKCMPKSSSSSSSNNNNNEGRRRRKKSRSRILVLVVVIVLVIAAAVA